MLHNIERDGFQEYQVVLTTHIGTHIDSPGHMIRGGRILDEYSISEFTGWAMVVDCRGSENTIPISSVDACINQTDKIEYLLFCTGWSKYWGTRKYTDTYPVLSPELCEWIVRQGFKGIGIDTISPDHLDSTSFDNHLTLLKNDLLIIENLSNLEQLINQSFQLICLHIPLAGVDGAPARVVALL
ncbi:MAG: cyclase family protein [Bacteroidales bacterium]|nr:cyclase family protein [Bacteroidales bacterium]